MSPHHSYAGCADFFAQVGQLRAPHDQGAPPLPASDWLPHPSQGRDRWSAMILCPLGTKTRHTWDRCLSATSPDLAEKGAVCRNHRTHLGPRQGVVQADERPPVRGNCTPGPRCGVSWLPAAGHLFVRGRRPVPLSCQGCKPPWRWAQAARYPLGPTSGRARRAAEPPHGPGPGTSSPPSGIRRWPLGHPTPWLRWPRRAPRRRS